MIATARSPRPLLTACAVGALLLGLAACGTAEEDAASPAAPTTAEASATPTETSAPSEASTTGTASPSGEATSSPADGGEAAALPAVVLAPVPGTQAAWSGEDFAVHAEGLAGILAGQLGADGDASATCEAELSSAAGQGVLCHGQSSAEGPASGESVWTAYPAFGRESDGYAAAVLLVQGENPLDAQTAELLATPGATVTGVGQGTMFLTRTLTEAETVEAVTSTLSSESAIFPVAGPVESVTCEGAMELQSMSPHSCTAVVAGEQRRLTVLPAQFLMSDGGLVLILAPAS